MLATAAHAAETSALSQVGQYLDLQPVGLPIIVQDRLVNYVFVYVRLNLTRSADLQRLRDKEPAFRDALVRDGHKTPFVLAGDWQKVDEVKLNAALLRDAAAIAGPGMISSVVVTSQSPQRRVMPPRPVAADHP
ncbi:hypothetical protein [Phenylobacterium sp.]|uniref:hypothetical protein n=1 Tax=Phenylobacterium sp. TaxID=1871053 RepID=UPI00286C8894|nr:hypothetical protein [Phenylobacterium sp.]